MRQRVISGQVLSGGCWLAGWLADFDRLWCDGLLNCGEEWFDCALWACVMVWPTFNGTGWNSAELGFLVLYFLVSKECRFPWRNCSSRKLSENEWSRQGAWHARYLHTRANWINWFASGSGQSLLAVDRGGQLAIVQNTWRTDGWMMCVAVCAPSQVKSVRDQQ